MSGSLEFRPLASDGDWELATAFRNGCDPSQPLTCDEVRHAAEGRAKFGYSEIGLFYAGLVGLTQLLPNNADPTTPRPGSRGCAGSTGARACPRR